MANDETIDPTALAAMTSDQRVEALTVWFRRQYEGAATPLGSNARGDGHRHLRGEVVSARNVFQQNFGSVVSEVEIERASREIESDGTSEWLLAEGEQQAEDGRLLATEDGSLLTTEDGLPISLEGTGEPRVFDSEVYEEGVFEGDKFGRDAYGRGAFSAGFSPGFDVRAIPDGDLQDEDFDGFGPFAGYQQQLVDRASSPILTADGERIMVDVPPKNEREARDEVIRRIDQLEQLIAPLVESRRGGIGDNNPPGPIEDPPFTRQEFLELRETLNEVREQTRRLRPEPNKLAEQESRLKSLAAKMRAWVLARLGGAIDGKVEDLIVSGFLASHIAQGLWWLAKTIGIWLGFI